MSHTTDRWREFDLLMDRLLDGLQSEADTRRLNELLRSDRAACRRYVGYVEVHGRLSLGEGNAKAHGGTSNDASGGTGLACGTQALGGAGLACGTQALGGTGLASGTQARETPGDGPMPHHSSFVAHPFVSMGALVSAYAAAALILAISVLIARTWDASGHHAVARNRPRPTPSVAERKSDHEATIVGKISAVAGCRWVDPKQAAVAGAAVPLGREFALTAGRLEISYGTGAKVVLDGPARYVAESDNGGFLWFGKLTAKVEQSAERAVGGGQSAAGRSPDLRIRNVEEGPNRTSPSHLFARLLVQSAKTGRLSYLNLETITARARPSVFSVRTPTTATRPSLLRMVPADTPHDDGTTEFSVEIDKGGVTTTHALRGTVDLHILSPADTYDYEMSIVQAHWTRLELDADRGFKMMFGISGPNGPDERIFQPVPVCSAQAKRIPPKIDQRKKRIN